MVLNKFTKEKKDYIKKNIHKTWRVMFRWLAHNKKIDSMAIWVIENATIIAVTVLVGLLLFVGLQINYLNNEVKNSENRNQILISKNNELVENNNDLIGRKDELLNKIEVLKASNRNLSFIQGCNKYSKHVRVASNEFKVDKNLINSMMIN